MSLEIKQIEVGGYDDNFSYLVFNPETKEAVVVDPSGEVTKLLEVIKELELKTTAIWLTHTHFDHMDGIPDFVNEYGELPIYVHELGESSVGHHKNVITVNEERGVILGEDVVDVLHTPGHIDDSVCFYIIDSVASDGVPKVITGDTLFVGGCGRTSDTRVKDLYESLSELANLPSETEVFPGHDYGTTQTSTIGRELKENKYYQVSNFNEFRALRLG